MSNFTQESQAHSNSFAQEYNYIFDIKNISKEDLNKTSSRLKTVLNQSIPTDVNPVGNTGISIEPNNTLIPPVSIVALNNEAVEVTASTTPGHLYDLMNHYNNDEVVLKYPYRYFNNDEHIDDMADSVKIAMLSKSKMELDNSIEFKTVINSKALTFEVTMAIKDKPLAVAKGTLSYGIKKGQVMHNGVMSQTLYPQVRIICNEYQGIHNNTTLQYLLSQLVGIEPKDLFKILDTAKQNNELITLINSLVNQPIDKKQLVDFLKMFNGDILLETRLDTPVVTGSQICINAKIGNITTVATKYEATIDASLREYLPKNTVEEALLPLKNSPMPVMAKGILYLGEYEQGALKQVLTRVNTLTGNVPAVQAGNLFDYSSGIVMGEHVGNGAVGSISQDQVSQLMSILTGMGK